MSNKITYRRDKKSQLTSNEVDDNFKYLDERIDKVSEKDYIIYDSGYASSINTVTVNKGCKWKISGVEYSNVVDQAFAVQQTQKGMYRVDIIYLDKNGVIDIKVGAESKTGYEKARVDALEYLYVYVNDKGVQRTANDNSGDYVSKLAMSWVDVDHDKAVLQATEQGCNINIIGGNKIIDTVANGIFEISVPATFSDGYEVAIRNLRSSYLTLVNSAKLRIYTGQNYTVRPGEIVVFKYDKREACFAVSGALDIRLDWQNVDEIIGVDSMRMVVDSSAGDALNPNDLNTKLTPTILRYFKDYTSDAVGWQWKRFSGDEAADTAWAKGKTKRVLELTPADFTDAINKGNVSFMCEAIVNNADVVGVWVGKLVDTAKTIRIQSTGTQFKGTSPEYILLRAIANNISVKKTEWFKDDVLTNISDSMMVYNNQVSSFVVMKLRVTGADGVVYEDAITLSKVVDGTNGKPGVDGKQGAVVVWTEWMTGSKHYNNDKEIYYIYHRPTQTVWKLKDGYNDIVAPANPDARYVQQPHLEQVVTKVLVAEGANIAGFIFKDGKMVSQYPSPNNPDLILDGTRGEIVAKKLTIVPGSPADKFIDDKIGGIEVGGRNLLLNSGNWVDKPVIEWGDNTKTTLDITSFVFPVLKLELPNGGLSGLWYKLLSDTYYVYSYELYTVDGLSIYDNTPLHYWASDVNTSMNKGYIKIYSRSTSLVEKNKWTKVSLLFKLTNNATYFKPFFYTNGFPVNTVFIRNIQLEKGNIVTDWSPAIEDTEAKIQDQEMYYEYSVDGKTGWHYPLQTTDHYERRKKGNGVWSDVLKITGIPGSPGKDGIQLYTWVRWADTPTSGISASPDGKSYTGYAYNKTSNMPSMVYSDYQWQLSKGNPGKDGTPGAKGDDGQQLYNWVRYADTPTSGMSVSPTGKAYFGIAVNKPVITPSSNYADYQWQLTKGNPGEQGVPGKPGVDGKTPIVHTAYSDSADGKINFHLSDSTNRSWWGTYTDYVSQDSNDPAKYKWMKTRGEPIASNLEPSGKYVGMIWVDTSKKPSEQKVWTGSSWELVGLSIDDIEVGGRNLVLQSTSINRLPLYAITAKSYTVIDNLLPSKVLFRYTDIVRKQNDNNAFYIPTLNNKEQFSVDLKGIDILISFYIRANSVQKLVLSYNAKTYDINDVFKRVEFSIRWSGSENLHYQLIGDNLSWYEIHSYKIEKGNIVTDWTFAPEDTEVELEAIREKNRQQERDINNLNNTTNILNQKTNYLTTTTTGNVVTTGTNEVGDANGNAKAGMTGVVSSNPVNISQNRRVVFYAGTGFANRENAKVQIWDDGKLVATDVLLTGVVNAIGGTFKNITAENLTVTSGVFNNVTANNFTVNSGTFNGTMNAKNGWFGNLYVSGNAVSNQPQGLDDKNNMLLWVRNKVGSQRYKKVLIGGYSEDSPDNIRQDVGAVQVYSQADVWDEDHIGSSFEVVGGKPERKMAIKVKGGGIGNLGGTAVAVQISSFFVTHESTIVYTGTGTLELNLPSSDTDRYDGRQVTVRNKYRNTNIRVSARDAGIWFFDTQNVPAWGAVTIGPKTTTVTFTYVDGTWYVTSLYGWS
ncbi:hypothetical protein AV926_04945 [Myroides marinus]|uniref:Tail protein n=1 Tax=Myroides marinus TaxID=703342 RepID=A0A161SB41_9FLAO|nr:hypothetical protein [Myroides marinus]KZE82899.1 hypothetical protein AV926_04945 [Myroides marinus]